MIDLTTCKKLHYIPRNSNYNVLFHNVAIKQVDNTWLKGCVYQCCTSFQIYTRPYALFNSDNWKYT